MRLVSASSLLDETRALLAEGRSVVCGSLEGHDGTGGPTPTAGSVLSLYDELRARLAAIDDQRITTLLAGIARNVEQLDRLAAQSDGLRRLRQSLARREP